MQTNVEANNVEEVLMWFFQIPEEGTIGKMLISKGDGKILVEVPCTFLKEISPLVSNLIEGKYE